MGALYTKLVRILWKRKQTSVEKLEAIEKELNYLSEYKAKTEMNQRRTVSYFLLYGVFFYIFSAAIIFIWYLPKSLLGRIQIIIPMLFGISIIYAAKKLMFHYFKSKLTKANKKLEHLGKEKTELLENIMNTESFNKAREILAKYAPDYLLTKKVINTSNALVVSSKSSQDLNLRQRKSTNGAKVNGVEKPIQDSPKELLLPKLLLPVKQRFTDRLMEYIIGDGPNYRYALICKACSGHNGMAIEEEFPYVSFNCCFCKVFNPAQNQRPHHPSITYEKHLPDIEEDSSSDQQETCNVIALMAPEHNDSSCELQDSPTRNPKHSSSLHLENNNLDNADMFRPRSNTN